MYFYVDESGNSGNNLFDPNQPVLSYGLLSSSTHLETQAADAFASILRKLPEPLLHANKLHFEGLRPIAGELLDLYENFGLGLDWFFIEKRAYALVSFFNAVFDAGLNEAVPFYWYWTPLRFPLIAELHTLLDDALLREAWDLCILARNAVDRHSERIARLLKACLERVEKAEMDAIPCKILRDGLLFGTRHPDKLDFGVYSQKAFSPNAVGFQLVLTGISHRLKQTGQAASKILVDRQTQFNAAQLDAFSMQSKKAEWFRKNPQDQQEYVSHPFLIGAEVDVRTLISHLPSQPFVVCESKDSIGLQMTDTFLWLLNRAIWEDDRVPAELRNLVTLLMTRGIKNGISIPLMVERWREFEKTLPSAASFSREQWAAGREMLREHQDRLSDLKLSE